LMSPLSDEDEGRQLAIMSNAARESDAIKVRSLFTECKSPHRILEV
jgi:hypothetical protein